MIVQYLAEYIFRKFDKRDWVIKNLVNLDEHHYRRHSNGSYYPKATIVIPTRDKSDLLRSCISSVRKLTEYPETEIIIVDNQSKETATISYLAELEASGVRVLRYNERFNYSAICNLAAENASGDYLCFLNNDTEVIRPDWLKCMVEHARQPEVGVVGAIMTFPHGRLQHMGVALEYTGVAGHPGRLELSIDDVPDTCFEVSAVTFACAVVSAEKFKKLGGLNPEFPVAFNDVDFSIRSANAGYQNVLCVRSHLLHHESRSRKRASSLSGFVQGVKDVLLLISKHQSSLSENFFARSILPNKPGKQRHFKSPKHHSAPKNGKQKDPKSIL